VCQKLFPETDGFYMDDNLKRELDIMIRNVVHDWDFTILISGQGEMRVGKSLLAMQICMYWSYQIKEMHGIDVPFTIKENMVLNGSEIISKGMKLGKKYKYAALDMDEAADDLESTKVMKGTTQQIKDYLRKSAQFNMLNVIIQSEFFEVPKPIAISRSCLLIDVFYTLDDLGNFKRGYFNGYGRRSKKLLYLNGKKQLDYKCGHPEIKNGWFPNFYPLNEAEYRKEKKDALNRWHKLTTTENRRFNWLKSCLKLLHTIGKGDEANPKPLTYIEIAQEINKNSEIKVSYKTISRILTGNKQEESEFEDEEV
jgi:hypothetical protein